MDLIQYAAHYCARRDVSAGYRAQLHWAAHGFQKCVGQTLLVDLSEPLVNAHLSCCKRRGLSVATRKRRRGNLLILWNAAADEGLAREPRVRQVMTIRQIQRIVRAWTVDDVRRLLEVADGLDGIYSGVPRRLYWPAYIRAAWDSGLRGCDLRSIETGWIPPTGALTIIQSKTGKAKRVRLRPSTLTAIAASYPPERRFVWPMHGCIESWRAEARAIVKAAGMHGSIKLLRHSSGTNVECKHPGRGHEHLGNGRQVFLLHYLDQDQTIEDRPMPEEL